MSDDTQTDAAPQPTVPGERAEAKQRMRWVKVDVSQETFDLLHDAANASRMRIIPFLRRYLSQAKPFVCQASSHGTFSFSRDH